MTIREDGFRRARALTGTLVAATLAGTGIGAAALWVATTQASSTENAASAATTTSSSPAGDDAAAVVQVPTSQSHSDDGWDEDGWDDDGDDDGWDNESDSDDDDEFEGRATSGTSSTIQAPTSSTSWNLGGSAAPVAPSSTAVSQATTAGS